MRIEKFAIAVGTNCYIVINEMTSECFAVDMADCPQEFVKHIKDAGLCVKALLLTHGHFDHIMGIDALRKSSDVRFMHMKGKKDILCDPVLNASATMLGQSYAFTKAAVCKSGYADRNRRLSGARLFRYAGTYRGRMLLLYRRRTCTVQRRYPVS
ncbi:MAG: MBL fold metallo-hydrolase [[Ruminococcus] torques]